MPRDEAILWLNARLSWEIAHEPLHVDIDLKKTGGINWAKNGICQYNFGEEFEARVSRVGALCCERK